VLGPDLVDLRQLDIIRQEARKATVESPVREAIAEPEQPADVEDAPKTVDPTGEKANE
jgi:hypothetical protein